MDLCSCVQNHGCDLDFGRSYPDRKSARYAYRAQDRSGNVCGRYGFLHLEARQEGLWRRK